MDTLSSGLTFARHARCVRSPLLFKPERLIYCPTIVTAISEAAETCSSIHLVQLNAGSTALFFDVVGTMFIGNTLGLVSSIVTLLTNVIATSLIGHQAWYVVVDILSGFYAVALIYQMSHQPQL